MKVYEVSFYSKAKGEKEWYWAGSKNVIIKKGGAQEAIAKAVGLYAKENPERTGKLRVTEAKLLAGEVE